MSFSTSNIETLRKEYLLAVRAGESPELEDFLSKVHEDQQDELLAVLIPIQIEHALESGHDLTSLSYERFGESAVRMAEQALSSTNFSNKQNQTSVAKTANVVSPPDASAKTVAGKTVVEEESNHAYEVDPERIGPYTLLRQIGRGGMGTVWEASQEFPVSRRVAIKLVRKDLDTDDAIARFEMERLAISRMEHPNIAKILDAGTAEDGRPYFVMELVKGRTIDRYCDKKRLTIRERIEIMIPLCKAIQHAHQKGIIHRDLKPSNVLVVDIDGVPTPKVIDFGVAKALQKDKLEDCATDLTLHGQVVGTLQYMSPEQSLGNEVDTRTDIYGLGALLYRLLTGSLPVSDVSIRSDSIVVYAEQLVNYDAPKLSSRFQENSGAALDVCKARQTTPERLRHELRGDLDCVVGKAVEREQSQRYQTVQEFAVDLERYLNNEEVLARPNSTINRVRKFVRRNRLAVFSAATIAMLLVAGIIGTSYGMMEARRAEERAKQNEVLAQNEASNARREQAEKEQLQSVQSIQLQSMRLKSAWSNWLLGKVSTAWHQLRSVEMKPAWETCYVQSEFSAMNRILYGHTSQVMAIDSSPQMGVFATAGTDHTIRIWDSQTYEQNHKLDLGAAITDLVFSNDGQQLYVTDYNNRLTVVSFKSNMKEPQVEQSNSFHGDLVCVCNVGMNGSVDSDALIAISESDVNSKKIGLPWTHSSVGQPKIHLVTPEDLSILQTLVGHDDTINFVASSATGNRLISGDAKGNVLVWKRNASGTFEEWKRLKFELKLNIGCFLANGKQLLLGCSDGTVRHVILEQTDEMPTIKQENRVYSVHTGPVVAIELGPQDSHGRSFATVSEDKTACVWDLKNIGPGTGTVEMRVKCRGHFAALNDVTFLNEGKQIATTSDDATVAVWSASTNPFTRSIKAFEELAWSADFSADGSRLVAVSEDGSIQLRSAQDLSLLQEAKVDSEVLCTAFAPNTNLLAHAGVDGSFTVREGSQLGKVCEISAHTGYIWDVAFSKDGRALATVGGDTYAKVWNTDTWQLEVELKGHEAEVSSVCFTSDGERILTASDDKTLRLWNRRGEQLYKFTGHKNVIWKVVISPDDQTAASSSYDGGIYIWDLQAKKLLHAIQGHQNQVAGLAISPDGQRVVSASDDKTIRVWDIKSGLEIFELSDPGDTHIVHASFSPDGRKLITGNSSGWLTLRTAATRRPLDSRYLPQQAIDFGIRGEKQVTDPTATKEQLALLLEEAAECCTYFPGYQAYTIRGIAEYRLGQHHEAIHSLQEAARLEPIEYGDPDVRPFIEAYLCLSHAKLGNWSEAEEQMAIFKSKRSDPALQFDPEVQALEKIVTATIGAKRN